MKITRCLRIGSIGGTVNEIVDKIRKEIERVVPENQRNSLKFELGYEEEYGDIYVFLEARYETEETKEEIDARIIAEAFRREQEIRRLKELKAKYPNI